MAILSFSKKKTNQIINFHFHYDVQVTINYYIHKKFNIIDYNKICFICQVLLNKNDFYVPMSVVS